MTLSRLFRHETILAVLTVIALIVLASLSDKFFTAENLLALRNTRIANLLGLPAISLPTGQPACGIMLMGRAGHDRGLLTIAAAAEAALRT